jgi:imidazoleglycerol-phosphate dehydratase / histidinol-phosphatase
MNKLMQKRVLFIDRDGVLIHEPQDTYQIDTWDRLSFIEGVMTYLGKITRELNYKLVLVSNQDGLGTAAYPESIFWPIHNHVMNTLKNEGIVFSEQHIDKSFEHENKDTRKPGVGMLNQYFNQDYDLAASFVIGDRLTDVQLAKNLGAKGIFFLHDYNRQVTFSSDLNHHLSFRAENWKAIYEFLKQKDATSLPHSRTLTTSRKTNETDIQIDINLDGTGKTNIKTGLHFFDHMLDQLGKHSGMDLSIQVKGDLHVDEHHTIEDTAIALGDTLLKALGDKLGIQRYAFVLPMDDSLAQVAIDLGGRAWLVWEAEFKREKVGDMPTEMFYHFFKSLSDGMKCNLNIKVEGDNEHHKIESIFKALAKCLKQAMSRDFNKMVLPSTKGTL